MIKLDGQFIYNFSLLNPKDLSDVEKDFISAENLIHLLLCESAGGDRPTLEMVFELEKESTLRYINKGNIINISFGISEPTEETLQFEIQDDNNNKNFSVGYAVKISAVLYKPKFMSTMGNQYYGNTSSIKVVSQIANNNKFNLYTNITKTNDKQEWNRIGTTEWKFLQDLWLGSYINDKTFISMGIDHHSIYFYDMRELCKQDPKWTFSTSKLGKKNAGIVPIAGYFTKNISGSISDLVGKNLKLQVFNIDSEQFSTSSYNLKNFTAIENLDKLDLNDYNCENYSYFISSGDVHENYIKAYNQNIRNNIMYSGFNIYASTALQFNKLHLFDLVKFDIYPTDERLRGTAIISALAYEYQEGRFNINITLNKEAPSGLRGTALKAGD